MRVSAAELYAYAASHPDVARLGLGADDIAAMLGNAVVENAARGGVFDGSRKAFGSERSYGIFQHNGSRLSGLKSHAAAAGKDWRDPRVQFDYALREMQGLDAGAKRALSSMKAAGSISEKARVFARDFERPSKAALANSAAARQRAAEQFAPGGKYQLASEVLPGEARQASAVPTTQRPEVPASLEAAMAISGANAAEQPSISATPASYGGLDFNDRAARSGVERMSDRAQMGLSDFERGLGPMSSVITATHGEHGPTNKTHTPGEAFDARTRGLSPEERNAQAAAALYSNPARIAIDDPSFPPHMHVDYNAGYGAGLAPRSNLAGLSPFMREELARFDADRRAGRPFAASVPDHLVPTPTPRPGTAETMIADAAPSRSPRDVMPLGVNPFDGDMDWAVPTERPANPFEAMYASAAGNNTLAGGRFGDWLANALGFETVPAEPKAAPVPTPRPDYTTPDDTLTDQSAIDREPGRGWEQAQFGNRVSGDWARAAEAANERVSPLGATDFASLDTHGGVSPRESGAIQYERPVVDTSDVRRNLDREFAQIAAEDAARSGQFQTMMASLSPQQAAAPQQATGWSDMAAAGAGLSQTPFDDWATTAQQANLQQQNAQYAAMQPSNALPTPFQPASNAVPTPSNAPMNMDEWNDIMGEDAKDPAAGRYSGLDTIGFNMPGMPVMANDPMTSQPQAPSAPGFSGTTQSFENMQAQQPPTYDALSAPSGATANPFDVPTLQEQTPYSPGYIDATRRDLDTYGHGKSMRGPVEMFDPSKSAGMRPGNAEHAYTNPRTGVTTYSGFKGIPDLNIAYKDDKQIGPFGALSGMSNPFTGSQIGDTLSGLGSRIGDAFGSFSVPGAAIGGMFGGLPGAGLGGFLGGLFNRDATSGTSGSNPFGDFFGGIFGGLFDRDDENENGGYGPSGGYGGGPTPV